jgi:hypothetical protein
MPTGQPKRRIRQETRKRAGTLIGSHARKLAKLCLQPSIDKSFGDID